MGRTINFFNYVIIRNNRKTNLALVDLLDQIYLVDWDKKLRRINDYPIGIFDIHLPDELSDSRVIAIGKFRQDYKPYIGHITTQKLRSIKNDVVEMVTMVASTRYQAVVIEYNQHGLRQGGIAEYLNSFLPNNKNEKWMVEFIPILSRKGIEDIKGSEQVRKIVIKLKISDIKRSILQEGTQIENKNNLITTILSNATNANDELDAEIIRLEFGAGQSQVSTMNLDAVVQVLEMLNIDSDVIDSLKVRFRDRHSNKLDTIDLKNKGGLLKDRILENEVLKNPGWQYIGNEMINSFCENQSTIYEAFKENISDQIDVDMPRIIVDPPETYKIKTEE